MGKKKKFKVKIKLNKKQRATAWAVGVPFVIGIVFLNIGILGTRWFEAHKQPTNLVWAADSSVKIPSDLRKFLLARNDCRSYRGTDTPTGVGLWGVFQVSKGKFAKIAYGCSIDVTNYIMAVKQPAGWTLLPPTQYFGPAQDNVSTGFVPLCSVLEKYKIDKSIESFCIAPDGTGRANTIE